MSYQFLFRPDWWRAPDLDKQFKQEEMGKFLPDIPLEDVNKITYPKVVVYDDNFQPIFVITGGAWNGGRWIKIGTNK